MANRLVSVDSVTNLLPALVRAELDKDYRTYVSVADFGAVGDGTTDDTAAVSAAIAYANSLNLGVVDAANVIGATIFFPVGRYKITGQLTAVMKSGVDFKGAGDNGTTLLLSYNGATFRYGTASSDLIVGGTVSDMKIEYLATPLGSATVFELQYASRFRFANLLMVNVATFIDAGVSSGRYASSISLSNIHGYVNNSGRAFVRLKHGAGLHMNNVRLFVTGVAAPAIDRVSTMTTVTNTCVVRVGEGGWDTIQMTGCFFERFDSGVLASVASGFVVNNIYIDNTYFDYHKSRAVMLEALSGGGIYGVRLSNNWYASWEESAIQMSGAGTIRGVTIIGGQIPSAGTHGINIAATTTRDIHITGVDIQAVNRTNVNAQGVLFLSGSHVTIDNIIAGYDTSWAGFAWQAYNGVYVVANNDHWSVTNCDLDGTGGGITLETNSAGSTNRLAHNNRGNISYDGYVSLTLPASAATTTNTTGTVWDIHIHGGTVTAIAKNGTTLTGMTSGHLRIGPGETFSLTYTGTPTVSRFVQQ